MLPHTLELTLAKEMVHLFWIMPVLGMRADLWTASTLLFLTVAIMKMQESVARMNVSSTVY